MSDLKTQPTDADVEAYLAAIPDPAMRADAEKVCAMMKAASGEAPVMWGTSIVGFGKFSYKYATGREGEWMVMGFAARKTALTLYGLHYYDRGLDKVMDLGKVKAGKGCLYIRRLADVDVAKLNQLIVDAWKRKGHLDR